MSTAKPVLAFLQNMWVRDPARVKALIARAEVDHGKEMAEELRLRFICRSLFAGCKTGRVLKKIFGQALIDQIVWEESTREISSNSREVFPADVEHIQTAIATHNPVVVVAFGRIAVAAVRPFCIATSVPPYRPYRVFIEAPHPAAIGRKFMDQLTEAAERLRKIFPT